MVRRRWRSDLAGQYAMAGRSAHGCSTPRWKKPGAQEYRDHPVRGSGPAGRPAPDNMDLLRRRRGLAKQLDRGLGLTDEGRQIPGPSCIPSCIRPTPNRRQPVAPAEGVEAFAHEQGYCTLEWLVVPVTDEADAGRAAGSRRPPSSPRLNASADPSAALPLWRRVRHRRGGRTFLPGRGILPAAVERPPRPWRRDSGRDPGGGRWVLSPPAPPAGYADAVAADFDSRLQQAAQEADITTTSAFDALEVPAFTSALPPRGSCGGRRNET